MPPGQARRALTEAERVERREERRAERRAEAEREAEAERIAQARAERRAARREAEELAAARAEAEREAEARAEARRVAEARVEEDESSDDVSRAAQILTALLAPRTQVAAPPTTRQALSLQQATTSVPTLVAQPAMSLTQALAQAAATGAIGF